jgi:hypothetical protein
MWFAAEMSYGVDRCPQRRLVARIFFFHWGWRLMGTFTQLGARLIDRLAQIPKKSTERCRSSLKNPALKSTEWISDGFGFL